MPEATIRLKLPLRRVMLADPIAPPPEWLRRQHHRLATVCSPSPCGSEDSTNGTDHPGHKSLGYRNSATVTADHPLQYAEPSEHESQIRERHTALEQAVEQLHLATRTLHTRWEQVLRPELQQATVELAHSIAAKLMLDRLAADQFPIENLVHEVLDRLNTDGPVVVKLHPADFTLWQQHVLHSVTAAEFGENIRVQADAALARGDCQATAAEITIVYELRRQIEDLRRQLMSAVNGHDGTEC